MKAFYLSADDQFRLALAAPSLYAIEGMICANSRYVIVLQNPNKNILPFVMTIAGLTALEGVRARLPWLIAAVIAAALGLGQFLTQMSMVEAAEIRITVMAAVLRVAAVFIIVVFVTSSMARDAGDKIMELLLSQPIPRWAYAIGKLAGYLVIALGIGIVFALPLWVHSPFWGTMAWFTSLTCELAIMASLSLFLALSLSQPVTAISAATAFYLLSRSMHDLQLIAAAAMDSQASMADHVISGTIDAVSLVLPALDKFTQSSWFFSPPDASSLVALLGEAALYVTLIATASVVDLYRKNF